MNVGVVVHDYDAGYGQGRYCIELAKRLSEKIRFTIFSNTFKAAPMDNVEWVKVPALRLDALTTVYSFIPMAERKVKKHQPDVIHCQGLTNWYADIITGHICNAARLRRMNTRWLKPRLFAGLVTPVERRFYRHKSVRHLIAISKILESEVRREYGFTKPATVVYHGTDCEQFRPAKPGEKEELRARFKVPVNEWTWLFMGEAVKGLRQTIDQLVNFPKARLLIVTRSDLQMYRDQAARLGVSDRVIFHGFEKKPEEAFRVADVFVYPSDYDPFGMVVSEAMASAIPVAVGFELGAAELIDDRWTGLKFDPHIPETIREALQFLEIDPNRARQLGLAGRAAIRGHSWDDCAAATLDVYRRVYREKRGA